MLAWCRPRRRRVAAGVTVYTRYYVLAVVAYRALSTVVLYRRGLHVASLYGDTSGSCSMRKVT